MSRAPQVSFPADCAAPFVSLHLDPHGAARVCCENRLYVVGKIPDQSLHEIWHGEALGRLRTAMREGNLDLGCEGCRSGIESGNRRSVRAALYDDLLVSDPHPPRPVRLELELSNRCNLQCVMCNGELSSLIRSQREKRPPLPPVYGDEFFDELADLASNLDQVLFLGGEPFLGPETLRAFDVLADNGFRGRCHVTTNGTVVNRRVARLLDRLRVDVSISVDGATAKTVEDIRVGVEYEQLQENIRWFEREVRARGGVLAFHYCLMPENWSELRTFLAWADRLDAEVIVLPVQHPMARSLDQLSPDALEDVIARLRAEDEAGPPLARNARAWSQQIDRLTAVVAHRRASSGAPVTLRATDATRQGAESPSVRFAELAAWADDRGVSHIEVDGNGVIAVARPDPADVLGMDLRPFVGSHSQELLSALRQQFGVITRSVILPSPAGCEDRVLHFDGGSGPTTLRALLIAPHDDEPARWYFGAKRGLVDGETT